MPMKQIFENYTAEDFQVWRTLFERQWSNLQDKSCSEYLKCLINLKDVLNAESIPKFAELNEWFSSKTKWQIETVPGLIPVDEFFNLLARKKFCSSTWLRKMSQLDYLEEPDMFHDIFGHIPILANETFSSFTQEMGILGKSFKHSEEKQIMLQRLYWFTIEFGLIQQNGTKIYGAGIISSFGESNFSLSDEVQKIPFDLNEVLSTFFRTDIIQDKYFVINSFEELFESIVKLKLEWSHELVHRK